MCVWECPLPLGCQSGRSVWRCCSQCKSTERETQRSTLRLPWAQTHAAWKHLTDTSYDRPVRCVQAQNQIWKPNKWVWTAPLLFYDGHLFQQISLGRRGKSIEKIKHSCLNGHVHTYFFIFPLALSLQNHWPGGINDNGEDSIKFLQICLTCLSIYVICKVCVHTFCLTGMLSGNSSVCLRTPQPWRSCCPGQAPCLQPPPHVADTWGSLPGWRSTVGPRLWSLGLFYWSTEEKDKGQRYRRRFTFLMSHWKV